MHNNSLFIIIDNSYIYTIKIDYTAKPNEIEASGSSAITDEKGLYFINPLGTDPKKMPQIWTQGETEASSCWFPTIDSPNEKTTQERACCDHVDASEPKLREEACSDYLLLKKVPAATPASLSPNQERRACGDDACWGATSPVRARALQ